MAGGGRAADLTLQPYFCFRAKAEDALVTPSCGDRRLGLRRRRRRRFHRPISRGVPAKDLLAELFVRGHDCGRRPRTEDQDQDQASPATLLRLSSPALQGVHGFPQGQSGIPNLAAKLLVTRRLHPPLRGTLVGRTKAVGRLRKVLLHILVLDQPLGIDARLGSSVGGHDPPQVVFWVLSSERGSSWISFSARGTPSASSWPRSRSASSSWPNSRARLVIQSHMSSTTTPLVAMSTPSLVRPVYRRPMIQPITRPPTKAATAAVGIGFSRATWDACAAACCAPSRAASGEASVTFAVAACF